MPEHNPAKARAVRLPLDSYSRDRLAVIRNFLTLIAVAIAIGWLFAADVNPEASYSPGPLSAAHAGLSCNQCHDSWAPISEKTFLAGVTDANQENQLWYHKTDVLCQTCHPVIGATETTAFATAKSIARFQLPIASHSMYQQLDKVDRCAECHQEHRGLQHLPSMVADQSCVRCHASINEFRREINGAVHDGITQFKVGSHPQFRSLQTDRGTLKFDHVLHMTPGLRRESDRESLNKTVADYPDHGGRLDNVVNADGLIELDCNFCHQPRGDSLSVGRYMSMPNYEQNCRVCHSIDLFPNQTRVDETGAITGNQDGDGAFESRFDVKALKIVHGADSETISNALKVYFNLEFFAPSKIRSEYEGAVLDMPLQVPTRLWNNNPAGADPLDRMQKEASLESMQRDFETATHVVRKNCLHCHLTSENDPGTGIPDVKLLKADDDLLADGGVFQKTWFNLSHFDHSAHRGFSCIECHQLNHGKSDLVRRRADLASDRPMIGGLENCTTCHTRQQVADLRYAPTNCTLCHTYHGGGSR